MCGHGNGCRIEWDGSDGPLPVHKGSHRRRRDSTQSRRIRFPSLLSPSSPRSVGPPSFVHELHHHLRLGANSASQGTFENMLQTPHRAARTMGGTNVSRKRGTA